MQFSDALNRDLALRSLIVRFRAPLALNSQLYQSTYPLSPPYRFRDLSIALQSEFEPCSAKYS